jgi:hypothetical protein
MILYFFCFSYLIEGLEMEGGGMGIGIFGMG